MPDQSIQQILAAAQAFQGGGRRAEAQAAYRQVLAIDPGNAEALHALGLLAYESGQHAAAAELISQAVAYAPTNGRYHNNLAVVLNLLNRRDQALAAAQEAVRLEPKLADAHVTLGIIHHAALRFVDAIAAFRAAIELDPGHAAAHSNLGASLSSVRRIPEAVQAHRTAVRLAPQSAIAHYNLGVALKEAGELDASIASLREAIRLHPPFFEACTHLGLALGSGGEIAAAINAFESAIRIRPAAPEPYNNIGSLLLRAKQPDAAMVWYQKALAADPHNARATANLAGALKEQGRLDESLLQYRRSIQLDPTSADDHGAMLFLLHYHPDYDAASILEEHRRWNERFAAPLTPRVAHTAAQDPHRRLRIGYVSPHFRKHYIGRVILTMLQEHDARTFEVFLYSNSPACDALTQRIRSQRLTWRSIHAMSDADAADLIRTDGIDILIDLAAHMEGGRPLVFARKPAAVQATWLGYPSTTGVQAIDYRITDAVLDPPGKYDADYVERSIHLPDSYWFFSAMNDVQIPNVRPADASGVSFGCLNNFAKVNDSLLDLWGRVLAGVPGSRLLLLAPPGVARGRTLARLAASNIAANRIDFADVAPRNQYLRRYHDIDIALDSFPYNGHTTTLDALWMGVPTVTLCGRTCVSRGGASLLQQVGLTELICHSPEEYVETAIRLANHRARFTDLRRTLRGMMQNSPLMNAARFTRGFEATLREMWQRHCAGRESDLGPGR
jgi:predicted O-linked N-acetylglucosamine transferase (SPINDLY family)